MKKKFNVTRLNMLKEDQKGNEMKGMREREWSKYQKNTLKGERDSAYY